MTVETRYTYVEISPGVTALGRYIDFNKPLVVRNLTIEQVFARHTALKRFGHQAEELLKYVIGTLNNRMTFHLEENVVHGNNFWGVSAPASSLFPNPPEKDENRDIKWRLHESTATIDVYHFNQRSESQYKRYPTTAKVNLDKL